MAFASGIPRQADQPGGPSLPGPEIRIKGWGAWCLTEALPGAHLSSIRADLEPIFWGVCQGLGLVIPLALASGTINWDR